MTATGEHAQLTALLVVPDQQMAQTLVAALKQARAFQVIAELHSYPPPQTLQIRVRQFAPEVVMLDVASDFATAAELIRSLARVNPPVHVIGVHRSNEPEALVGALRAGASEFLYAPFEAAAQQEAAARIRRLRQPESSSPRQPGKLLMFSSVKPGAGASTLASQTAFALHRLTAQRVLMVDMDFMSGTTSFYLRAPASRALEQLLIAGNQLPASRWTSLIERIHGVDVLPAPPAPGLEAADPARLHELAEYARRNYDWVLLDLPAIFHRLSLLALAECDTGFLVTTMDLASLHLARKAVRMLGHLGLTQDRFRVLVNRVGKGDGLRLSDMQKVIECPAHARFPSDEFALQRMLTLGEPLDAGSELGSSVEEFAGKLAGVAQADKKRTGLVLHALPVFSESS
ncbi:MAG: AAA family ATPase [Bryobacteraceae bacterium]